MNNLSQYIIEKLKINKDSNKYHYQPKDKKELKELIEKLVKERGNDADLNDINVSKVTDMSWMFNKCESLTTLNLGPNFDTSKVTSMRCMFGRTMSPAPTRRTPIPYSRRRLIWLMTDQP